ncbi:hypothetical protein C1N53_04875 [Pontibacter sp. SGAir0037]|nr:hypothetical protein C1N53_04875 [Pontibacter sp. SGAir0037]
MVQILADIHTVEARIENRVSYPDTSLMVFNKEQSKVLEQHDVTLEQFKETYQFYLDNVKQMDKLYEVIIDTLSAREVKARTSYQPNQLKVEGTELRPVE